MSLALIPMARRKGRPAKKTLERTLLYSLPFLGQCRFLLVHDFTLPPIGRHECRALPRPWQICSVLVPPTEIHVINTRRLCSFKFHAHISLLARLFSLFVSTDSFYGIFVASWSTNQHGSWIQRCSRTKLKLLWIGTFHRPSSLSVFVGKSERLSYMKLKFANLAGARNESRFPSRN